ncbi:MAG: flagellar hook-basal body protein [Candidatus Coatesbacteria bacterium]
MYTSASGMLAEASRHDAIANNLANVSTTGFKRDAAVIRAHPTQLMHRLNDSLISLGGITSDLAPQVGTRGQGALVDAILPNNTQGSLMQTDNPTDVALEGQGYIMVDTVRGRRYTRAGDFAVDGRGRLVTQAGDPVLTSTGAQIMVGRRRLDIGADGGILLDGEAVGTLGVVEPDDTSMLTKEGESLLAPVPGARFRASGSRVIQGHLERSNVNAVTEMVAMLEALRTYEANQRAITAQDETINTLITQVGRFG